MLSNQKQKRNRSGYEDGVTTLYKECPAENFVLSEKPAEMLGQFHAFLLDAKVRRRRKTKRNDDGFFFFFVKKRERRSETNDGSSLPPDDERAVRYRVAARAEADDDQSYFHSLSDLL